jgi:hypothetical protein
MLPPFIIEQIRKREEDERSRQDQAVLELPIPRPRIPRRGEGAAEEEPTRGVIILEM